MRLQCYICFKKHPVDFTTLVYNDLDDYDGYDLKEHIRKEHTIDEILESFVTIHFDMLMIPERERY